MKKTTTVGLIIFSLVVASIFGFWLFLNHINDELKQTLVTNDQQGVGIAEKEALLVKAAGEDGVLSEEEALSLVPPEARAYYRAAAKGDKDDIRFYVKVVDQNGQPVPNAFVHIDVGGGFLSGGKQGQAKTNEDGVVPIFIEGSFIMIEDVTHPEIEYIAPKSPRGEMFYGFQPGSAGGAKLWTDYQTESSPYVIKTWRFEDLPSLKSRCMGDSHLGQGINRTIYLDPPARQRPALKGDHQDGQLIYSLYVDPLEEGVLPRDSDPRRWTFSLSAIGGGVALAPETDLYLNQAPDTGYQTSVSVTGKSKPYGNSVEIGPVYFQSHGGSTFGAIVFRLNPTHYQTEESSVRLCYKANLNGSGNLQSDSGWLRRL